MTKEENSRLGTSRLVQLNRREVSRSQSEDEIPTGWNPRVRPVRGHVTSGSLRADMFHTDQHLQQVVIDARQRLPPEQEAAKLVAVRGRCVLLLGGVQVLHWVLVGMTGDGVKGLLPLSSAVWSYVSAQSKAFLMDDEQPGASPVNPGARCPAEAVALSRTGSC